MVRQFQGREIELLAPVGTFADFQEVIQSAADAVYLGGKKFNMRMHNPKHNLTNEEIQQAVTIAHDLQKKVYVTFNNMMTDAEIDDAADYLCFLESVGVDALIIQDFGGVQLIRDLGLDLELHLSVMANVHNQEMIAAAKELGVTRCVISREASLDQVHEFVKEMPEMEYEYFMHGDMCIAHGAQCYASGVFFGKSGNRGLCMKPCRWAYQEEDGEHYYPMAVKDMSLYQHIPELILSGINSYKIEGRMRGSDYLIQLINQYGEAIDRFLADPIGYQTDPVGTKYLEDNRVRDLSTAYAFGRPGANNVAFDGKREPRVFSRPNEEPAIRKKRLAKIIADWQVADEDHQPLELGVTVDHVAAALAALRENIDTLILSGEALAPNHPFTLAEIKKILQKSQAKGIPVFYGLPRMVTEQQLRLLDGFIDELVNLGISGLMCSNLGEIHRYQHLPVKLRGDYGLNVYNHSSGKFYQSQGLESITLSIEAPATILAAAPKQMPLDTEIIVQGTPTLMYMEHSFKKAQQARTHEDWVNTDSGNDNLDLVDERGFQRKIREDQYGKNHLLPTKDFSYGALLPELSRLGVKAIRIEGKEYDAETLTAVLRLYDELRQKTTADLAERMTWVQRLTDITENQQSLQTLVFD